jgi:hypothetical protein
VTAVLSVSAGGPVYSLAIRLPATPSHYRQASRAPLGHRGVPGGSLPQTSMAKAL